MKKVIQLISTMNTGGAETMVKDYALLVDKEKVQMKIVVMSGQYHSTNEQILKDKGIEIIYLGELLYGEKEDLNPLQKVLRRVSRYYYFRKLILEEKPDVLHVHLHFGWYLKVLPLKKLNMKLLFTVHNVIENFFDAVPGWKEKYFEYREADRLIKKYGMTLIALHDDMNRELRDFFHTENVVTINNGIMLSRFNKQLYDREEIRKSLGVGTEEFVVGHVGRYHEQKNHELIVNVFKELLKIKPNSKLLLIGKGPLKEEITKKIEREGLTDYVIMLENRQDVPQLMDAMDVFLFPSRWEGFGNVLIEAQSMGLRCVISDKVPESVILTENVQIKSLEEPLTAWVEAILNFNKKSVPRGTLTEHDMIYCVERLQHIYLDEPL